LTDAQVGPCQLHTACAPHIAASMEGVAIDRQRLLQAALALAAHADVLVVEGVGGFCVPLGPDWDSADLASDLGLPVVLVIGLRLGCLNHALLTAETIRARGLPIAGWVTSSIDPSMTHAADNVATLHHELGRRWKAPCLGVVPTLESPHAAAVAACLNDAALRSAFERQWPLSNPFSLRTA